MPEEMAILRVEWCDFVVYGNEADVDYWDHLSKEFYVHHVINCLENFFTL